jgi:dihydrofolate reductase
VLTRQPPSSAVEGVTFLDHLETAVAAAKAAAGNKYVNVLGATTARGCLEAGLLDEVLTLIAPIMLGDGVRLFDHPGGSPVRLERMSLTEAPLATNIWMRVLK